MVNFSNPGLPLQLLRINKQVNEEATEILYGGHSFMFVIGPTARVRQIYIHPKVSVHVCTEKAYRAHYDCYRFFA